MTKFQELCLSGDIWDMWDSLCNACPMYYTEADLIHEFAKRYEVDPREVFEYFF
jgi:hypothetical protein